MNEALETLGLIQSQLNAPKGQTNKFGGYNYRSCEDILEALKPLLETHQAAVTLSDEVVDVNGATYIKATATLYANNSSVVVDGWAQEGSLKGMSPSQCSGSASSYARKYALNGLFAIDDSKDADALNTHGKEPKKQGTKETPSSVSKKPRFAKDSGWRDYAVPFGKNKDVKLGTLEDRSLKWYIDNIDEDKVEFRKYLDMAKAEKFAEEEAENNKAMTPNVVSEDELPF